VPNHERIYRVQSDYKLSDEKERFAGTSLGLGPLLADEYDYIDNYTRLHHIDVNVLFKNGSRRFYEENIVIADSNFFNVFEIPFLHGLPQQALNRPGCIVVTQSFAKRYFDNENPLGKVVSTNNHDYTITGVIADLPANTHHTFDAVLSHSIFFEPLTREQQAQNLWYTNIYTFLEIENPANVERLYSDFDDFYHRYMQAIGDNFGGYYRIFLSPLAKIHFGEKLQYDQAGGDKAYLYAFAAIGILILVLACINYVNMATARGMRRVKEAGLRKVLGGSNAEIRLLIFSESLVLSIMSLLLAFSLVELVLELTPFNRVLQKDLALDFWRFPALWWLPLGLALLVGFVSGWYPAIALGKVPGLAAIQGGYNAGRQSVRLRRFLVGFQFCVSVAVVITALGMYRQMDYVSNKDLGFNKEDVLLIPIQDTLLARKIPELTHQLQQSRYVLAASTAQSVPGGNMDRAPLSIETIDNGTYIRDVVDIMMVGLNYFKTMEIDIVVGREFRDNDKHTNTKALVVNSQMVKTMGWDNAIGRKLKWGFDESGNELYEGVVVGVSENFNSHSLHQPIEPTVIFLQEKNLGTMHIRLDSENLMAAITDVERIWGKADPENPFQFSFLNKDLMNLYEEEQRQSRLILYLTYLAIFISFLGLTGLASFTTSMRTREIGIRKVLGADVLQMVNLIFRDMLKLIIISVVLAIPFAYILIKVWLSGFAYSASLDPFIFAFSAALAILLAYLIVSYHSLRVARSNPVNTLKYE
jgi:putative ABC transport system permease protein